MGSQCQRGETIESNVAYDSNRANNGTLGFFVDFSLRYMNLGNWFLKAVGSFESKDKKRERETMWYLNYSSNQPRQISGIILFYRWETQGLKTLSHFPTPQFIKWKMNTLHSLPLPPTNKYLLSTYRVLVLDSGEPDDYLNLYLADPGGHSFFTSV